MKVERFYLGRPVAGWERVIDGGRFQYPDATWVRCYATRELAVAAVRKLNLREPALSEDEETIEARVR